VTAPARHGSPRRLLGKLGVNRSAVFNLGMGEITVILLLALIVIGPKGLPELAATLGKIIRDIRKTAASVKNEIQLDDAVRKPFEELRDAITLSPDELLRRDRIKKELEDLQKKFTSEVQSSIAAATAPLTGETETSPASEAGPAVEGGPATESGEDAATGASPTAVAAEVAGVAEGQPNATGGDAHTTAAEAVAGLEAPADGRAGSKTLPFGSATGLPVPVRAPDGTVARTSSARASQRVAAVPPPPPPPIDAGHTTLNGQGPALSGGEPIPAALHAVSLPAPPSAAVHAPPPPPARKTAPRLPVPPETGAAARQNVTQALSEADLIAAAATLVSPPPPPPTGRPSRSLPTTPAEPPAPPPTGGDDKASKT